MTLSVEQREQLLCAKLSALSRQHVQLDAQPKVLGALAVSQADGRASVLLESGQAGDLGAAFLWAGRNNVQQLDLFVDDGAQLIARLATYFDIPSTVWAVTGSDAARVEPAELPEPAVPPQIDEGLIETLVNAGCEVVLEHGIYRGEINGLEVARLVQWPTDTGGDGEFHLEVGVGRFDRDATAAVHADTSPHELLELTVALIQQHRQPGALSHPVQYMSRSRWLRANLVKNPQPFGFENLSFVDMTSEATGIKDDHPCAALGTTLSGDAALLVCSTGVDLSLAARAADTRAFHNPQAQLHIAVPERDATTVTRTLATLLKDPATVHPIPVDWITK